MKEKDLKNLIKKMTLDEKIGQLVQITGYLYNGNKTKTEYLNEINIPKDMKYNIGSILNVVGAEQVIKIQYDYLLNNRLKIPLIFMSDIINGYKLVFPIPLAQGCSWDIELIKDCARISMQEASVAGVNVNFSPMLDLVRDSRWGRVMESFGGEDVLLAKVYAEAIINTYKGNNIAEAGNVAACVKHFAAYGAVESGREYNTVDMSERELRQYYLPAYKQAIESGAEMIMTSFNIIGGIPVSANKWLLNDILRKEWNFDGIIISDYSATEELINHGIAENGEQAAYKAVKAGVDIDMMSNVYINNLKKLLEKQEISESEIDEKVLRVLNLKNKLGLFESPYGNADIEKEKKTILCKDNLEKAKKLTAETFVLLKNEENILPLKQNKIALIGPYADNKGITGMWSPFSDKSRINTLKNVLEDKIGKENLLYAKGSEILRQEQINAIFRADGKPEIEIEDEQKKEEEDLQQAIKIANNSDIIVLAIGEHYRQSGEGASRANIDLPENQQILLNQLYSLGKPIVAILFNGRPLAIKSIAEKVDALIEVWFPGTMGAEAIVDVLFGEINPSGKLTMSFPQSVGQCPIYYNHYNTGRPHVRDYRFQSRYQDIPTQSYYPFGYGLSYSKFNISNLNLDKTKMSKEDNIKVKVLVKNESNIAGKAVIQLYIQDLVGSVVRPVKELKDFKKIYLKEQEEKEVEFTITEEMLKFWNENLEYKAEEGKFNVYVGDSSTNTIKGEFEYI